MYFIKQNRNQKGLPEIGTSNIVATATAVTTVGDSFTPLRHSNIQQRHYSEAAR